MIYMQARKTQMATEFKESTWKLYSAGKE